MTRLHQGGDEASPSGSLCTWTTSNRRWTTTTEPRLTCSYGGTVSRMGNVSLDCDVSPLPQHLGPTARTTTTTTTAEGAATRATTRAACSLGACLKPRQGNASESARGQDTSANKRAARPATTAGASRLTRPTTPLRLWRPRSHGDTPRKGPPTTAGAERDAPLHAANPKRPPSRDDAAAQGSTLRTQIDTTTAPQGCLHQQLVTHLPLNPLLCAGTSRRTGRRPWRLQTRTRRQRHLHSHLATPLQHARVVGRSPGPLAHRFRPGIVYVRRRRSMSTQQQVAAAQQVSNSDVVVMLA